MLQTMSPGRCPTVVVEGNDLAVDDRIGQRLGLSCDRSELSGPISPLRVFRVACSFCGVVSSGWATTRSARKEELFRFSRACRHEHKGGFYCGDILRPSPNDQISRLKLPSIS